MIKMISWNIDHGCLTWLTESWGSSINGSCSYWQEGGILRRGYCEWSVDDNWSSKATHSWLPQRSKWPGKTGFKRNLECWQIRICTLFDDGFDATLCTICRRSQIQPWGACVSSFKTSIAIWWDQPRVIHSSTKVKTILLWGKFIFLRSLINVNRMHFIKSKHHRKKS